MTKDEALRLALEALEYMDVTAERYVDKQIPVNAITAIKAALEAKDEPVKLRRGDILRCNESDELCTVWATSTSGKTLVKWKDNDFGNYTAEQIGELFWIEPKEKDEPDYKALWQQMCERCDELDKKLAQRKPLTDEEIQQIFIANSVVVDNGNAYMVAGLRALNITEAIEAKLKEKNT